MEPLKGAAAAKIIKENLTKELAERKKAPVLAIIRVGERPDDLSYERGARKRMEGLGIEVRSYVYDAEISNDDFFEAFTAINEDEAIDGILMLRPLPKQIDEAACVKAMKPEKDVDGITSANLAKIFMDERDGFAPCTAQAVVELAKASGISLSGKHAVVVGRSLVVGKPLSQLLLKENCTVTVCHSRTVGLKEICRQADILAVAVGRAKYLDGSYIKPGAIVLDVGINVDENNNLCGDVDYASLDASVAMATPVPGGVGAVTTWVLAQHVTEAAKRKERNE